jgi:hypothetical protein
MGSMERTAPTETKANPSPLEPEVDSAIHFFLREKLVLKSVSRSAQSRLEPQEMRPF